MDYIHMNTNTGNVVLHMDSEDKYFYMEMVPNPEIRFAMGLPPLSMLEIETAVRAFSKKHGLECMIDGIKKNES